MATYTFRELAAWPIGAGGALRAARGQRVNVTDPSTGLAPAGLTQGGVAVSWVTSGSLGEIEFTTADVPVVDLSTLDGTLSRRVEAVESVGDIDGGSL